MFNCCNCRRCFRLWPVIFVAFCFCFILPPVRSQDLHLSLDSSGLNNSSCLSIKAAWTAKGYGSHMIPVLPTTGDELEVCRPSAQEASSCCTRQMELKLYSEAAKTLNKTLGAKIQLIKGTFQSQATGFNTLCQQLIDRSSRELHTLFKLTYGTTYENNTQIFSELFRQLKTYYSGVDVELTDVLDSFFGRLMQRLFVLINAQYSFDETYLSCVDMQLESISPFGDVPQKVTVSLKRAFVASRTFYQGLVIGRDTITALEQLDLTQSCFKAVTRMSFCQYCSPNTQSVTANSSVKPCNPLCMNVMRGCLAQFHEVNVAWNAYLDSLLKLASRLQSSFSLDTAIRPINVKISEGIMNFQEDSDKITEKVFQACGQPRLTGGHRARRAAARNAFRQPAGPTTASPAAAAAAAAASDDAFDSTVTEIRGKLLAARDFWSNLPETLCSSQASPVSSTGQCWNGYSLTRYASPIVQPGLAHQANNSEVDVSARRVSVVVDRQILLLSIMTNRLKNAFLGLDVEWLNTVDSSDASGGGSGEGDIRDMSGSGYPEDPDDGIDIVERPEQPLHTLRPPRTTHRPVVHVTSHRRPVTRVSVVYEKPTTRQHHRPNHGMHQTTTVGYRHSSSTTVWTTMTSLSLLGITCLTVIFNIFC